MPGSKLLLLATPRRSNQEEGDPGLPPLRGALDQSQSSGAAQLALVRHTNRPHCGARTVLAYTSARLRLLFGGAQGKQTSNLQISMKIKIALHTAWYTEQFRYDTFVPRLNYHEMAREYL
ncbi:MAG: hypothetical protein KGJ19_09150 [Betaproteobacteria bacterium]|nr:hypothetical protein [Betaproteobacteria bacterium]